MSNEEGYTVKGYLALRNLFQPIVLRAFYEQMRIDLEQQHGSMRRFTARGPLITRDAIEIYSMHYPPMQAFLWGLTPRIAQVAGCELLPTYAYFRLYQQGDICKIHSDRHACEHSLSLTVAYGEDRLWGLSVGSHQLENPTPIVSDDFGDEPFGTIEMKPGDGVLYQGTHRRHGRLDPNPNSWSAHLFLHWVDAHGRYADQAFDRPTIENARQQASSS